MSVEVIESNLINDAAEQLFADSYDEQGAPTDARRRLEDKIEEMRLRREICEFDFDI